MNLAFFGSGAFGLPTLAALAREHHLVGIVSQPDKPAGRGSALTPTPIAEYVARSLPELPLVKPENVNESSIAAQIASWNADAAVIIAFGQKLGAGVLPGGLGSLRAINLHASLLPRWRGAGPINAAVLAGDAITGNSIITIAERMDAGLVLGQSQRTIDSLMTAGELHDALAGDGPELVLRVLREIAAATATGTAQDDSLVTKARKLSKKDGWIEFGAGAEQCRRRVHGLTPWPGVTVRLREEPLKLLRVQPRAAEHRETPGTLLDAAAGLVACAGDTLALLEVQPAGGKKMAWADFARGRRIQRGEVLIGGAAC